jgi:hypothetical protein
MSTQKTYSADIKADGAKGAFKALVSVYGNVDLQGDRVMPGAFDDSIASWQKSGDPLPIVYSHDWANPFHHIGIADPKDIQSTPDGLVVTGRLDIDDNPTARQVHKLMQRRSLKEFSFSYDIQDEKRGKDGANELRKVHLIEAGPTLKGANPETQLLAVKAMLGDEEFHRAVAQLTEEPAEAKAGRAISRTNATRLLAARDLLDELIALSEGMDSGAEEEAKTDEPQAKVDERPSVVALRERIAAVAAGG